MKVINISTIDEVLIKDAVMQIQAENPDIKVNLFDEWELGQKSDADSQLLISRVKDINPTILVISTSHVMGSYETAAAVCQHAPSLSYIVRAGVGTDHVDKQAATENGVRVINEPFGNNESTAEWTIRLLFAALQDDNQDDVVEIPSEIFTIPESEYMECHDYRIKAKNQKQWIQDRLSRDIEKILSPICRGQIESLRNKRVGVLGLGHIGRHTAIKLHQINERYQLGLEFFAYNRSDIFDNSEEEQIKELIAKADIHLLDSAQKLFSESDVITVHISGLPENEGFINAQYLNNCRTQILINTSRDFIINHLDLKKQLETNENFTYASDFAIGGLPELMKHEKVISSNHIAGIPRSANEKVWYNVGRIIQSLVKEIMGNLTDDDIPFNVVNTPPETGWRNG